jgi:hypothetical protein
MRDTLRMPRDDVLMPRDDVLRVVLAALDEAGIVAAVGGSGLLAALGLVDQVRDWDVTTDASPEAVAAALSMRRIRHSSEPAGDGPYATCARLCVNGGDHAIDIIVGFAVELDGTVVRFPTRITDYWRGLPLADPWVWAEAYCLIGRESRAEALDAWLRAQADA